MTAVRVCPVCGGPGPTAAGPAGCAGRRSSGWPGSTASRRRAGPRVPMTMGCQSPRRDRRRSMPCMPKKPRKAVMSPAAFRKLLAALGLTQRAAAKLMGVSPSIVCLWAKGTTPIAEPTRRLIEACLKKTQD